jgi:hypothetical protein
MQNTADPNQFSVDPDLGRQKWPQKEKLEKPDVLSAG